MPSAVVRLLRAAAVALLAFGLALTSTAVVRADELDDRKAQVDQALVQSQVDLEHYSKEAIQAAAELRSSEARLAQARAALAKAESQVRAAQAEDARLAAELAAAQAALARAKAEAAKAAADVEAFHQKIGARAREQMQQRRSVNGLAILISDTSTADLNQKVQWGTTIFDSSGREMDQLRSLKLKRDAAQVAATEAEATVAKARQQAADHLATSRQTASRATSARDAVAQATQQLSQAKARADALVAAESVRQQQLETEQASVNKRIMERIARQKAEAARQAAAAREAQAARDAAARAASRGRASSIGKKTSTAAKATSSTRWTAASETPLFSAPVSGPITSYYGMRLHPVLHYWKLHDGTDYGASCGAPIRAPRAGVVAEKYYNAGYGNRLMIDHGVVNGSYITTGYNHATYYVVSVGQRVSRGQVIGYVGTTGYSTGCHLHLMVWDDGAVIDPLRWF